MVLAAKKLVFKRKGTTKRKTERKTEVKKNCNLLRELNVEIVGLGLQPELGQVGWADGPAGEGE